MPRGPEPKTPRPAWSKALLARRVYLDLLQTDLSERTEDEISQGTISDLERGKTELVNMTAPRLSALAAALEWTIEEMEAATGLRLQSIAAAHDLGKASPAFQTHPLPATRISDNIVSSERVRIPVYALAAAGAGVWSEEDVLEYIDVEPEVAHRRHRTTFKVDGSSMEPTINHGDFIHVDLADQDIRDGKIFVVKIKDNGIVVKRARVYETGVVLLTSDNPQHPPLHPDAAVVIGRVFGVNPAFRAL